MSFLTANDIEQQLLKVFPRWHVKGKITSCDCVECDFLRKQLAGKNWPDISAEFVCEEFGALPLLTYEAYVLFLPAWLREGIRDPDGAVAGMLLVNLCADPDVSEFSAIQKSAIVDVARFIAAHNIYGPEDQVNVESLAKIERIWS